MRKMNKKDREELEELVEQLRSIAEREREKADNLAEYFSGERVETQEEIADSIEEAVETLDGVVRI